MFVPVFCSTRRTPSGPFPLHPAPPDTFGTPLSFPDRVHVSAVSSASVKYSVLASVPVHVSAFTSSPALGPSHVIRLLLVILLPLPFSLNGSVLVPLISFSFASLPDSFHRRLFQSLIYLILSLYLSHPLSSPCVNSCSTSTPSYSSFLPSACFFVCPLSLSLSFRISVLTSALVPENVPPVQIPTFIHFSAPPVFFRQCRRVGYKRVDAEPKISIQ